MEKQLNFENLSVFYAKTRAAKDGSQFKSLGINLPKENKKSLESLFEDFKEDVVELPNGGVRFGAVAFDSDGKFYISGSSPQEMQSEVGDNISFNIHLCIKGEEYTASDGSTGKYSKTHLRVEYFQNHTRKEAKQKAKSKVLAALDLAEAAKEMGIDLDVTSLLGGSEANSKTVSEPSDTRELED